MNTIFARIKNTFPNSGWHGAVGILELNTGTHGVAEARFTLDGFVGDLYVTDLSHFEKVSCTDYQRYVIERNREMEKNLSQVKED